MLKMDDFLQVRLLRQQGHSIKSIARETGLSRNTVRKVLREKVPVAYARESRPGLLDAYKDYALKRFGEGISAIRIFQEIQPMGFAGSYDLLRKYLGEHRKHQRAEQRVTVRFETPPGEQAQCDWAEVGRFADAYGKVCRVYAFLLVLGFSRMLYVEFTRSMDVFTLIRCHQNAFAYLGGWTRRILYDNMKQVVVSATRVNPIFLDFARHHDFLIQRHRPYRPRTKGKVERSVDYLKDNFLKGRTFEGIEDLQGQGRQWLEQVANVRVHGTTQARPADLWKQENLVPMNSVRPFQLIHCEQRRVGVEGTVRFGKSAYSVPVRFVGRTVAVESSCGRIRVRLGECVVAEHEQAPHPGSVVEDPEHVRERWALCQPQRTPKADAPESLCAFIPAEHASVPVRDLEHYQQLVP